LPIVIPLAIAHARSGWSAPRSLAEMFSSEHDSVAAGNLGLRKNLFDARRHAANLNLETIQLANAA